MNFDWLSLAHLDGGRSVSLPSATKKICWDIELMENIGWQHHKKQKNNQKTKKTISIWELSSFNHQTPSFQCWSFQIFQRSNIQVSHFQSFELSTTKDRAFNPPTFSFLSFNHRNSDSQSSSIGLLIYKFLKLQVANFDVFELSTIKDRAFNLSI